LRRGEVFGDDPVALWTSLLPRAQSIAVEAGYRVSGRFGWGSGSSLARWVMVAEGLPDRDDKQWFRAYVVPRQTASSSSSPTITSAFEWRSDRRARLMITASKNCAGVTDRRSIKEARCELAAWIAKCDRRFPRLVGWVEEII
jgi:hypothetical protein